MKFYTITCIIVFSLFLNNFQNEQPFVYESITQEKELQESIEDGKAIYSDFCISCHLGSGEGVEGIYPPLAESNWLSEKRTQSLKAVKYGLSGEIKVNGETYNNNMTSMGLTDREVTDVLNYVMNSFGNETNNYEQVTLEEVSSVSED